jgi:hypothetical protein
MSWMPPGGNGDVGVVVIVKSAALAPSFVIESPVSGTLPRFAGLCR